jgi:hypothetical protein
MSRSRRLVLAMGVGAAITASPAWAQDPNCWDPDKTGCVRFMAAPLCDGPAHWCDPVHGEIATQFGQAGLVAYQALAGTRFVAMHRFTLQSASSPLALRFNANWEPTLWLLDGGHVPLGESVAYLGSTSFGGAVADPQQGGLPHGVRLDDSLLNGRPDAIVIATRVATQGSAVSAAGAWYDGYYWWVYNEDVAAMPPGELFFYAEGTAHGGRALHTSQNDFFGFGVFLDDPRLNGNPDAVVVAQHVFAGALNASPLGVWYDPASARWVVFNELGSPLALGEWIHYMVAP